MNSLSSSRSKFASVGSERFLLCEQSLIFAKFPMECTSYLFRIFLRRNFSDDFENLPSDTRMDFFSIPFKMNRLPCFLIFPEKFALNKDFSIVSSVIDLFKKGSLIREKFDLLTMPPLNKEDPLEGIITPYEPPDVFSVQLNC